MDDDDAKITKYHRMIMLENKHHTTGKLSKKEDSELKELHTAHGAGFFDSVKDFMSNLIIKHHPVFQFLRSSAEKARTGQR